MKTNKFTFMSSNKINTIHASEWIPDGKPRAVLQLAHGMQEFMKNYEGFAEFMCSNGFYVVGFDCIGHGESAEISDLGYFPDADSTEFLILDMRYVTETARKRFPDIPYIMFGHSFGSFLTRIYISRYRDVDGAIIMGSGDMDLKHIKRLIALIDIHSRRNDGHFRSKFIQAAAFGRKLRKFLPLKNNFEWSTRDEQKINEYLNEKRNNYVFTLNGFKTLFTTVKKSQDKSVIENTPKDLPVLIISGDNDAIGDYGKGTKRIYNSMCAAGMRSVSLELYKDARHNLLQEICCDEVHERILEWCVSIV